MSSWPVRTRYGAVPAALHHGAARRHRDVCGWAMFGELGVPGSAPNHVYVSIELVRSVRALLVLGSEMDQAGRPRVVHVPASHPTEHDQPTDDAALLARIHELIQLHPTYGYRRIWARLRVGDKRLINRKNVRRLMRQQGWMVRQRPAAPKPRVGAASIGSG